MLFRNNPLSAITSIVCDWGKFCLGHCIRGVKGEPVRWHEIEQEISGSYIFQAVLQPGTPMGRKVAVIGAGPAGISTAIRLREKGADVEIFESRQRMGGMLRYGIPPFRLERKYIDRLEQILADAGVAFHPGTTLGRDFSLAELQTRFDAVVVCAGAWVPKGMGISGEELPCVLHALHYLEEPQVHTLGAKVLVVGGGNVAMDACRTALRTGSDTTVVYRKTFENMPANPIEVEQARSEGVKFEVFTVPVAIRMGDGRPVATMRRCENYTREDGSLATRILEGTDFDLEFDTMIMAISEKPDSSLLDGASAEGLFKAGDFAHGPATVVQAVKSAQECADAVIEYLENK